MTPAGAGLNALPEFLLDLDKHPTKERSLTAIDPDTEFADIADRFVQDHAVDTGGPRQHHSSRGSRTEIETAQLSQHLCCVCAREKEGCVVAFDAVDLRWTPGQPCDEMRQHLAGRSSL